MGKPKVLFVILPYLVEPSADGAKIRSYHAAPYGVLSIATYCKDLASIRVVDLNDPEAAFDWHMNDFLPDIVGFSMMFDSSYMHLRPLLAIAKQYGCMTLLGGAAASYSYREILDEQDDLDAVCFGEGEQPFRLLLEGRGFGSGSWVVKNAEHDCAPVMSNIQNLDSLIDIDYSFVNPEAYSMKQAFSPFVDHGKHKQFFVMTTRGCPFFCSFCSNAAIHGKAVRYASVDAIIRHVERLIGDHGMDVLTIYDDQLLLDKPRAKELFRRLAPFNLRIEAPNGLGVAFIDREMAYLMRRAGMDTAYLAIESGSEYVLRDLIRKPLKLWMVPEAVAALREQEFFIHGFFVMGMPGETAENRLETKFAIRDWDLDWAGLNMATPVRGSELYRQCIENGWIEPQRIEDIVDKKYVIRWPEWCNTNWIEGYSGTAAPGTMVNVYHEPAEVEAEVYQMNIDVNFHHNRRMRIGDYPVAARCFEEVLRRYPGHEWAKMYLQKCKEKMNESR